MPSTVEREVLALNQELLESIAKGDWETYRRLCDPEITCFEPEARGHLVQGLPFHQFYFDLKSSGPRTTTMSSPHVRVCGDTAIVAYVRLVQKLDAQQQPVVTSTEETRIWHKGPNGWRHVHFHRS